MLHQRFLGTLCRWAEKFLGEINRVFGISLLELVYKFLIILLDTAGIRCFIALNWWNILIHFVIRGIAITVYSSFIRLIGCYLVIGCNKHVSAASWICIYKVLLWVWIRQGTSIYIHSKSLLIFLFLANCLPGYSKVIFPLKAAFCPC